MGHGKLWRPQETKEGNIGDNLHIGKNIGIREGDMSLVEAMSSLIVGKIMPKDPHL